MADEVVGGKRPAGPGRGRGQGRGGKRGRRGRGGYYRRQLPSQAQAFAAVRALRLRGELQGSLVLLRTDPAGQRTLSQACIGKPAAPQGPPAAPPTAAPAELAGAEAAEEGERCAGLGACVPARMTGAHTVLMRKVVVRADTLTPRPLPSQRRRGPRRRLRRRRRRP